jgi:hypothetical protein
MTEQAPRINAQYLEAFTGKTVMITGKVSQIRGESAVIDANGEVTVLLNRVRALSPYLYIYHLSIRRHQISPNAIFPLTLRRSIGIAPQTRKRC